MKTILLNILCILLALSALSTTQVLAQDLIPQGATPAVPGSPVIITQKAVGQSESIDCEKCKCHACRCIDEQRRAGYPQRVAFWAVPSRSHKYGGYIVGGTTPLDRHGDAPGVAEGTWGWDYFGGLFKRRVINSWIHGRDHGKPFGSYKTDGPNHLHDLHKKRDARKAQRQGH